MTRLQRITFWCGLAMMASCRLTAAELVWQSPPVQDADGPIVIRVAALEDDDEDPRTAGRAVAQKLLKAMGSVPLKAVVVSECFEDLKAKQALIDGICSVVPAEQVFGGATYGSFSQDGCTGFDSVCLLGFGGDGIAASATLVQEMGIGKLTMEEDEEQLRSRLQRAGARLARHLPEARLNRLVILLADAHSPSNQFLVEGAQQVLGRPFPITGGSANKNSGQTFVYFQGKAYSDSAVALGLSGDFKVTLAGRKAMDNDQVIQTAREAAADALERTTGEPQAVLAFNCAGRRGKLRRPLDELHAIQQVLGKQLPLFGCYCAGEIGPVEASERTPGTLSGGAGWHVMFTVIGR